MTIDVPYDVALLIFDFAVEGDDLHVAKAMRLVNRECALRFARPVWFVGARNHYFNYLRSLNVYERRVTVRWLCTDCHGSVKLAARVAAEATSEAMQDDHNLFPALAKCTKFRI